MPNNTVCLFVTSYWADAHFISEFLHSCVTQTEAPDEFVVFCSGANPEVADSIVLEESGETVPVRLVSVENTCSAGTARNMALEFSSSDIISFCDVDDFMHPQRIEEVRHVFENNDVDLFVHNYTRGDRGQQNASPPERIHDLNSGLYEILEHDKNSTNLIAKYAIAHGPCSVKRDVLKAIKYQDWNYAEDGDFCQRVLKSGYKVLGTSHKLLYYCRKN